MRKSELKRNFSMSYADLSSIGRQKTDTILRDIEKFKRMGITASEVTNFKEQIANFENLRVDEGLRGDVKQATRDKNEARELLIYEIRIAENLLKRIFDKSNTIFERMRIVGLWTKNDNQIIRTVKAVLYELDLIRDSFDSFGYSNESYSNLETLCENFSSKMDNKENLINRRDQATENRINEANNIYKQLVIYTNIGKLIWERESEAYYNDYIISPSYLSPPKNSSAPEQEDDYNEEFGDNS